MLYAPGSARINNRIIYFVFWSSESSEYGFCSEAIVLDERGAIATYSSLSDMYSEYHRKGLKIIEDEPIVVNLDDVKNWLRLPRRRTVDPVNFLNVWYLFSDLNSAVNAEGENLSNICRHKIYEKIFWGNNFPALTPPGKHYTPRWNRSEINKMHRILMAGMRLFTTRIYCETAQS